jgi:quercetin dioxygenase-like cupin family protein
MTETEAEGWISMREGIRRRTIAAGERMMQMLVVLDRGAHLPEHQHPHEQLTHVLRGRLRFLIAGEARELGPGESVCLPGGTPHGADALEETLVIDTFSPPREDLLAEDRARTKN